MLTLRTLSKQLKKNRYIKATVNIFSRNVIYDRKCSVIIKKSKFSTKSVVFQNPQLTKIIVYYKRPQCEFYNEEISKMKKHLKEIHNSMAFKCPECNAGFMDYTNFLKHVINDHRGIKISKQPYEIIKKEVPMSEIEIKESTENKVRFDLH